VSKQEPVQINIYHKIKSPNRYSNRKQAEEEEEETITTMSSRALLFSFSPPSPSSSPQSRTRIILSNHSPSPFPFHFLSRRRGGGGKVWADVKSEKHVPEPSSKYQDLALHKKLARALVGDDVEEEEEDEEASSPWWEIFPKRWVIVILCFSAFLLCNMDRVSMLLFLPIFSTYFMN
jgi:ACS family sodium-dependent inorganic phosphate cotransporter